MDEVQSIDVSVTASLFQEQPEWVIALLTSTDALVLLLDLHGYIFHTNPGWEHATGCPTYEVVGKPVEDVLSNPSDQVHFREHLNHLAQGNPWQPFQSHWYNAREGDRPIIWFGHPLTNSQGQVEYVLCTGMTVSLPSSSQAARPPNHSPNPLMGQVTHLCTQITQRIRESLQLESILNITVSEVRALLQVERVVIYQLSPTRPNQFVVESLAPGCRSILGDTAEDLCFSQVYAEAYRQGRISVVHDVWQTDISPCYRDLLQQIEVRALLLAPIVYDDQLWGLLCAHQCSEPRHWQNCEIDLLQQLAAQVALAIQQSSLYHQIQQLNTDLEQQVTERTAQLQQMLNFESILKRVTDRVRDSLDESQILETVVTELGAALGVACCDTGIYDAQLTHSTIRYEYAPSMPSAIGATFALTEAEHIYHFLLQGDYVQFCEIDSPIIRKVPERFAILACPIFDDQGTLGDLWLFKPKHESFSDSEIRLVQQVANQCAIAIRQARLYQATEHQVEELANLIRLKDEFLSRVSHELRTPVSNMKMAIQMLAITLNQDRPFLAELSKPVVEQNRLAGYFRVLRDECEREIRLLNDLLDLQRLDTGNHTLSPILIDLTQWLTPILDPFYARADSKQQCITVELAPELPPLVSSPGSLERILRELLDNACKYTPDQERILFKVWANSKHMYFEVTNFGIEIPANQLPRIFDRFYWVPGRDRWQQGGTGLGLALVQKLTKRLGGAITVASEAGQTCFTVSIPLLNSGNF